MIVRVGEYTLEFYPYPSHLRYSNIQKNTELFKIFRLIIVNCIKKKLVQNGTKKSTFQDFPIENFPKRWSKTELICIINLPRNL